MAQTARLSKAAEPGRLTRRNDFLPARLGVAYPREVPSMNSIIYIVGLVVIVIAVLAFVL